MVGGVVGEPLLQPLLDPTRQPMASLASAPSCAAQPAAPSCVAEPTRAANVKRIMESVPRFSTLLLHHAVLRRDADSWGAAPSGAAMGDWFLGVWACVTEKQSRSYEFSFDLPDAGKRLFVTASRERVSAAVESSNGSFSFGAVAEVPHDWARYDDSLVYVVETALRKAGVEDA